MSSNNFIKSFISHNSALLSGLAGLFEEVGPMFLGHPAVDAINTAAASVKAASDALATASNQVAASPIVATPVVDTKTVVTAAINAALPALVETATAAALAEVNKALGVSGEVVQAPVAVSDVNPKLAAMLPDAVSGNPPMEGVLPDPAQAPTPAPVAPEGSDSI